MSLTSRYIAIGTVAGFASAVFGVGGGIIAVPLLLVWTGMQIKPATATSLAAIGVTAAAGLANYWAHGDVSPWAGLLLGLPAAAGAIAGSSLQQRLKSKTVELLFAGLVFAIAIWLFLR